jgi:suppressor for copper-sensitivity B
MRADWTKPSEQIANYLASFNRFGIPFNVIYGHNSPSGVVLPELLSNDAVFAGLGKAGFSANVATAN